jgi:hypothetical protein
MLVPRSCLAVTSGVVVLNKNPETEKATLVADGLEWPNVLLDFEQMIKPFAEQLGSHMGLRSPDLDILVSHLLMALVDWYTHLLRHKTDGVIAVLTNAKLHAKGLQEELSRIDRIPMFLRDDVVGPEFSQLNNLLKNDRWSMIYSQNMNFGELIEAACSLVNPFDKAFDDHSRGRPRGIAEHPALHRLVFHLAYAAAWARLSLSAYVKENGKTKVAVGTLIDSLDMLREHFAQEPNWEWLTLYLPVPDQHQHHVATYRRLLKSASEAWPER